MYRRKLIAGTAVALPASFGGCLEATSVPSGGGTSDDPSDGDDGTDDNGDESERVPEDPRTDTPPHEIDPPRRGKADGEQWNAAYLGEHVATEPSLDVTRFSVGRGAVRDTGIAPDDADSVYRAELLTSETDRDEALDLGAVDAEARARLADVDFDRSVLVVVESGYGSGSVDHRWARAEPTTDGVHFHGYYTDPFEKTDDVTTRVSVLEVERPAADVSLARVSLTVGEERRVHFNSTEGVLEIDDETPPSGSETGAGDEPLDSPRDLVLENEHDETHTLTVALIGEAGEIHRDAYRLEPGTERRVGAVITEPGTRVIDAALDSGSRETEKQRVSDEVGDAYVTITSEGELLASYDTSESG